MGNIEAEETELLGGGRTMDFMAGAYQLLDRAILCIMPQILITGVGKKIGDFSSYI